MTDVPQEAIAAFLEFDPSYKDFPVDTLVETWIFQMFKVMWEINNVADEIAVTNPDLAEALRAHYKERVQLVRHEMEIESEKTLRGWGLIP